MATRVLVPFLRLLSFEHEHLSQLIFPASFFSYVAYLARTYCTDLWKLSPFFFYSFTCDWSKVDWRSWVYATPPDGGTLSSQTNLYGNFNLTFTSDASQNVSAKYSLSVNDANRVPQSFEAKLVDKFNVWSINVLPLVQMQLTMMLNILHGTRLLRAWEFVGTRAP